MFTRISLVFASLIAATALAAACPPLLTPPEELPLKKPEPPKLELLDAHFPHVGTVLALDGETGTIKYSVVAPRGIYELVLEPGSRLQSRLIGWRYERVIRTAKLDQL